MRVAIISGLRWDSSIGKHTIYYANALSKEAETLLILRDDPILHEQDILDKNIKTVLLPVSRMLDPMNLANIRRIKTAIKNFQPDVIDYRSGYPWDSFGLFFIKKYPIVVTIETAKPRKGEKKRVSEKLSTRIVFRYADQFIARGKTPREILNKEFNIPLENIHISPYGNYAEAYTKIYNMSGSTLKQPGKDEDHILYFGRIVQFKGLKYLIDAEPYITKEVPNAKIVIAGSCDDFSPYEKLMINKKSFITYIQWTTDEMLSELFHSASIVVLPYIEYSESGNIAVAYEFGKPIVASNVGSIEEYVEDGKTGYLVESRNPRELAKAIVKLLKNKKRAVKMGEAGKQKMRLDYSWDGIVKDSLKIYKKTINGVQ
ncbi:MAG: glycosyltransferase family 4 protein [Thermoplasmata archaeon]|nr:MAG: glycosyltransferase family 4 protein [Thermoplasmata archaeon]